MLIKKIYFTQLPCIEYKKETIPFEDCNDSLYAFHNQLHIQHHLLLCLSLLYLLL